MEPIRRGCGVGGGRAEVCGRAYSPVINMQRHPMSNVSKRQQLLGGARAPTVGGSSTTNIYDDETAKSIESHSNLLQSQLFDKVSTLKGVRTTRSLYISQNQDRCHRFHPALVIIVGFGHEDRS